jgi:hypothetical protein
MNLIGLIIIIHPGCILPPKKDFLTRSAIGFGSDIMPTGVMGILNNIIFDEVSGETCY